MVRFSLTSFIVIVYVVAWLTEGLRLESLDIFGFLRISFTFPLDFFRISPFLLLFISVAPHHGADKAAGAGETNSAAAAGVPRAGAAL